MTDPVFLNNCKPKQPVSTNTQMASGTSYESMLKKTDISTYNLIHADLEDFNSLLKVIPKMIASGQKVI